MKTLTDKEWTDFGLNAELCGYSPSKMKLNHYPKMTTTEIGAKLIKLAKERMQQQDRLPITETVIVKHNDYYWRDVFENGVHYRNIFSRL
jgi:hypothetical protein